MVTMTKNDVKYPYPFLSNFLMRKGFTVYPHEMVCGSINCQHERNRFVDVAARKDGKCYAFEYKSAGDYLMRAVKQVENYRLSFDYVIVVAEVPRCDVSVHPTRGVRIKELLKLGAGFWTVNFRTTQNEPSKQHIADALYKLNQNTPIQAHDVGTDRTRYLENNVDKWFWTFYTVMDRRSDASTFVKAKHILAKYQLFKPSDVVAQVEAIGKEKTVEKITSVLKEHKFPLLIDKTRGDRSHAFSIVEAALFMKKFNYDYDTLYKHYRKNRNLTEARDHLWHDFKNEIYGVGDRIASQFIRGMVLRANWRFPLNDDRFLEKCHFNMQIAQQIGLNYEELGKFADEYLNGNRGVIAHALWYLRKRYCSQHLCYECPLYYNCIGREITDCEIRQIVEPKQQNPIPENHEWITLKFTHQLRILQQQPINQTRLIDFPKTVATATA